MLLSWAKEISLEVELDWKLWRTGAVPASLSWGFPHNPGLWSMQGTRSVTTSNCLVRLSALIQLSNNLYCISWNRRIDPVSLRVLLHRQPQPDSSFPEESQHRNRHPSQGVAGLSSSFLYFLFSAEVFRELKPVRYQDSFRQQRKPWKLWKRRRRL